MKILFATPHYSEWCTCDYAYSLYRTKWPEGAQVDLVACMGCAVGKAVDNFAREAVEKKYDYLILSSNDAGWKPDAVIKLISDNKDVVSGWSRERFHPFRAKVFTGIDRENVRMTYRVGIGTGLEKVYSIAGEIGVYKVDVFRKIKYPWFEGLLNPKGEPTSDDFVFGCKAYDAGIEIWVDWDVSLTHIAAGMKTDRNGLRAT